MLAFTQCAHALSAHWYYGFAFIAIGWVIQAVQGDKNVNY